MSIIDAELSDRLTQEFPDGFHDASFDISRILIGFEEHMPREIKDARIPMNWTETELQWDPICNALFDHASDGRRACLMFVEMISEESTEL